MRNTDHTSSQDETKEKAEEKEKEKKEKEVKPHTLKSNNPHLTGGEKKVLGGVTHTISLDCTFTTYIFHRCNSSQHMCLLAFVVVCCGEAQGHWDIYKVRL